MNRFSTRRAAGLPVAVIAMALIATATPAAAQQSDIKGITNQVASAISQLETRSPQLVVEPASTTSDIDSAAVTTQGKVTVDIPRDAKDGITLGKDKTRITIGLPNAASAGPATRLPSGTVVYPSMSGHFSNAAVPAKEGAQALSIIRSKEATATFAYPLRQAPKGSKFVIAHDGSVLLVDANGKWLRISARAAWAQDARGKPVKTHYTTNGTTLTQHVAHKAQGVTYPVVADPRFDYHWWGWTVRLNRTDTQALAAGAIYLVGLASPIAGAILAVGGVYFAQSAVARRTCVGYAYPWGSVRGWLYFTPC